MTATFIVAHTDSQHIDHWRAFSDEDYQNPRAAADDYYNTVCNDPGTYVASLTSVLASTDYNTQPSTQRRFVEVGLGDHFWHRGVQWTKINNGSAIANSDYDAISKGCTLPFMPDALVYAH